MVEISERLRGAFLEAGWYDGRSVPVAPDVPAWHPAAAILTAMGGLTVGTCGDGEECAASDIVFTPNASSDTPSIVLWSELLATRLACIGEVHQGHGALLVDSAGRLFKMSLVHDAFVLEGETFGAAMEGLLLGRRGRPLLRPDQTGVFCWGEEIGTGDPRIFAYRR